MFARFGRHVRQQYAGFLALFVALGGVSYAAITLPDNSVGSKQIKRAAVKNSDLGKSAVTGSKVKDGSLLSVDFKPGQLPSGAPGAKGDLGAPGPKGDNGTNGTDGATGPAGPFPATLPSGKTLTGTFVASDRDDTQGNAFAEISFTFPLLSAPGANLRAPGSAATANCPGTLANPQAAAGQLCVYAQTAVGSVAIYDPVSLNPNTTSRFGALVQALGSPNGFVSGTWAVTAP